MTSFVSNRYRHEIAHDAVRIYILGGGTSWTSYPLDKVKSICALFLHCVVFEASSLHLCSFIDLLFQIHAYNLETNWWEEIKTKPHERIG